MRQVPRYLIIGNGRIARHFRHYFSMLNLAYDSWHRLQTLEQLSQKLSQASHVLLLISDCAIERFIIENLIDTPPLRIHFSGSLVSEYGYGAHPLMTFNEDLYDLKHYQQIPFTIDDDAPAFEELLPGLSNPSVRLPKTLKPRYHALCVLSGNFSCILWQKLFSDFENLLNIPPSLAHPYLLQMANNLIISPKTSLTGPLVRNDKETIKNNLLALQDDPFEAIYESFVECYQKLQKDTER